MPQNKNTVIFDLFNVLVKWNIKKPYEKIVEDKKRLKFLVDVVLSTEFDDMKEVLNSLPLAIELRKKDFPDYEYELDSYSLLETKMFNGYIKGNIEILKELRKNGFKRYLLSNLPKDSIPWARRNFGFWDLFDGVMISGEEGRSKPDPAFYRMMLRRFDINPQDAVFIDDRRPNIIGAEKVGIEGYLFTTSKKLRKFLEKKKLL